MTNSRALAVLLPVIAAALVTVACSDPEDLVQVIPGVILSDAAPTPDAAPTEPAVEAATEADLCTRVCSLAAMSECAPDSAGCLQGCAAALVGPCGQFSRASLECQAARRPEEFTCDARGRRVLSAGQCKTEDKALVACLMGTTGG